mmetsp:Transcript_22979/g.50081  ORF Transcript_22979/g.50081 Transcript_22979/m.50081 type:complete len:93 (-) Transcript_22979:446-724(-)
MDDGGGGGSLPFDEEPRRTRSSATANHTDNVFVSNDDRSVIGLRRDVVSYNHHHHHESASTNGDVFDGIVENERGSGACDDSDAGASALMSV